MRHSIYHMSKASMGYTGFFVALVQRGLGLGFFGLAVFLMCALVSYDPGDPSMNTVVDGPVRNSCGPMGAILADLLHQFFGLSAYALPALFVGWAYKIVRAHPLSYFGLRLLLLPVVVCAVAMCVEIIGQFTGHNTVSGVVGVLFVRNARNLLSSLQLTTYLFPISLVWMLVTGGGLWTLSGFDREDIRDVARGLYRGVMAPRDFVMRVVAFIARLESLLRKPVRKAAPIVEKMSRVEPSVRAEIPVPERAVTPAVHKPIQVAARVDTPLQKTLTLTSADSYHLPPLDLLTPEPPVQSRSSIGRAVLEENARHLMEILEEFGIRGEITQVRPGPVVTLYELVPAPGIKSSRVIGLADDIARSMSALAARIAVIPGHNAIGIELPNKERETVFLRELFLSRDYDSPTMKLGMALGKDISGATIITDLARMPHVLVAGTTGSGKSVAINAMILSLLYRLSPDRCRLIMIDPKMLELSVYDGIPHLLAPVVTDPKKAVYALKWTVKEMEDRYRAMSKLGVRNIEGYNARLAQALAKGEELTRQVQTGFDLDTGRPLFETQPLDMTPLPYIVVVVDEMADLMLVAGKEIETTVQRLAQMARAAGIHLIMATQRPSVDVITGTIKANFPTRISFQVTSRFDSRTILSEQGAEQLLGRGDMLYMEPGGKIQRVHGPFVSDSEVEQVVRFLKTQGVPNYIETITEESGDVSLGSAGEQEGGDALYQQALELVRREGKASTSFIQRHLQIGYNRAARIIEQMENDGVVSPANHVGKREVLLAS